ncbi:hypothetical protein I7I48_02813 [Histoplasma ohiense]|nr:hypothetical protein I7I48_02813 [Histoplasma ohiense (nom. inval.)]
MAIRIVRIRVMRRWNICVYTLLLKLKGKASGEWQLGRVCMYRYIYDGGNVFLAGSKGHVTELHLKGLVDERTTEEEEWNRFEKNELR